MPASRHGSARLWRPQTSRANPPSSTGSGWRCSSLFPHHLSEKPVSTFRDDALFRHRGLDEPRPERNPGWKHVIIEVIGRMMQARAVPIADEDEGAGPRLEHEGEVLSAHHGRRIGVDRIAA